MATPVSSGTLNLSASGTSSDTSRSAIDATLKLSFSDLLRGQIQGDFNTRTPDASPLANPRPASTPTRTPPETPRTPSDASSQAPARPSQESAHTRNAESGQTVKHPTEPQDAAPPSQQAVTGKSSNEKTPENTTSHTLQPQLIDTAISPDLPATIAALLLGIAGEITEDIPDNDTGPETSARGAPTLTAHSRHPAATDIPSARAATPAAMQDGVDVESHADNDTGTNQNTPTAFTGQASRHSSPTTAPTLQGAAPDITLNTVSAGSMIPREDGAPRIAPATPGDISMLNPPRLPAQAAAALPQFIIPASSGQRAWAEEIGNRVMWMLGRAESRAELILTPPLLGKVAVSIHLNGDQSTAQFLASSQSAREALEQAMPRLRELLAQAGISLGEASVNTSAEGRPQAGNGENAHRTGTHDLDAHDGDASVITEPHWSRLDSGLINTFA